MKKHEEHKKMIEEKKEETLRACEAQELRMDVEKWKREEKKNEKGKGEGKGFWSGWHIVEESE